MPTVIACVIAAPVGYLCVRRLRAALAFSVLLAGLGGLALTGREGLAIAAVALTGVMIALLPSAAETDVEMEIDELEVAQARAELALEGLAGQPGGALHEDLAIGALLSAIAAVDREEQIAGFRQAEQIALKGRQVVASDLR